jgi:hypothetical protein
MTIEHSKRMADRIEIWPTDKLVPYDKNPRTHSTEQVNQIAASIAEFGFLNPILVDTTAGIIAGHGRLQAAKQLGLAQVPVVVLNHLTDAQKRAYVIADNKLALNAGWDDDLLRTEMAALLRKISICPSSVFQMTSWRPCWPNQTWLKENRRGRRARSAGNARQQAR